MITEARRNIERALEAKLRQGTLEPLLINDATSVVVSLAKEVHHAGLVRLQQLFQRGLHRARSRRCRERHVDGATPFSVSPRRARVQV